MNERTERRLNQIIEKAVKEGCIMKDWVEDLFCVSDCTAGRYLKKVTKQKNFKKEGIVEVLITPLYNSVFPLFGCQMEGNEPYLQWNTFVMKRKDKRAYNVACLLIYILIPTRPSRSTRLSSIGLLIKYSSTAFLAPNHDP